MKRFLALLMAMAMTFSVVMPSVAAAHKGSASGNASQVAVQSENADEDADKSEKSSDRQDAEADSPRDEGKSKSGDASRADEKEKDDEKSGSDEDAADKDDDSSGDKSEKADDSSGDKSGDASSKEEPSDGEKKDEKSPDDSSRDVDEERDDSGEKSAREQEQGPVLRELRASLKCVDGVTYTVTVACPEEAELPEGTELSLAELNQALTKEEKKLPENRDRPYKTEKFVSKKALEQVSFDLHSGLRVKEDDYVFFTKFLDLSLTHKGQAVQPRVPVQVSIETDVVSEGASDTLEAALYDAKATEKWQKDLKERRKKAKERLPDTIFTRVPLENETRKKKGVRLCFETEEFARLGLTGVAKSLKSWDCQGETVRVYGPRHLKAEVRNADMKDPEAGLEKLRAFTVKVTEKQRPDYDVKFWVGREQPADGLSTQESADERVGVAARKLSSGKAKKELFAAEDKRAPAAFQEGDDIGLVWDTGFRDQTLKARDVTLSGLLPKGAQVEATDVSARYPDPARVKRDRSGKKLSTIAAYDITIKDGEQAYQPEAGKSVKVTIRDADILDDQKLAVWHLLDDGTVEEVADFTVEGETIRFSANGFSVYMVVNTNPTSLEDALSHAVNGDTIRLDSDLTASVRTNKELTIDLNGHTLTVEGDGLVSTAGGTLTFCKGTLTSATSAAPITVYGNGGSVILGGDLTVGADDSLTTRSDNSGAVILDGATVQGGLSVENSGHLTISGGTVSGAVTVSGGSTLTVTGGTVSGTVTTSDGATVTVSGGHFSQPLESTWAVDSGKVIIVKADSDTKTYDGTPLTVSTYTTTNLPDGYQLEGITVGGSQTDAGTGVSTASGTDAKVYDIDHHDVTSQYHFVYVDGSLRVLPKPASVTAQDQTKMYGEADPALTADVDGVLGEDSLVYTLSREAGENKGGYTITAAGETVQGNYTVSYHDAILTITPKPLRITAASGEKVYDGTALTANDYTSDPLRDGDTLSVTVTGSQTNVGVSDNELSVQQITDANGTDVTDNYAITPTNGVLTVTPKAVTVTANDCSKVFGQTDPGLTATVTGLVGSDRVVYTLTRDSGEDADTYDIIPSGDSDQGNYSVDYQKGVFTIQPKPVNVTITGHTDTITYDGTEHSVSGYDVAISDPDYFESYISFSGVAEALRTDVDTTQMRLRPNLFQNQNDNYEVTFSVTDGWLKIEPVSNVKVTITGHTDTQDYDGIEHSVSGYDVSFSNSLYTADDFLFRGAAEATGTAVATANGGKYLMGLAADQFTNTNPNFTNVIFEVTDGWLEIKPIDVQVTITGLTDTVDYDGQEHSVSGYTAESSTPLFDVFEDIVFSGTAEAVRTDAGQTDMGLAAGQFSTANPNFANVTFDVTDGWLEIVPVGVTVTITGHSNTEPIPYDGAEHTITGYDVEISDPLYHENDFTFSGTPSVSRTNAGTSPMGLASGQFTNINPNFTNVTFEVTDGEITIDPIDAVVTITGHTDTFDYDEQEHSVTGYTATADTSLYQTTAIHFNGTAEAKRTEAGTTSMNLHEGMFSNTDPNFANVTFYVTDGWVTVDPKVVVSKTLNNELSTAPEDFRFEVILEKDGAPVANRTLGSGLIPGTGDTVINGPITTNSEGKATFFLRVRHGETTSVDLSIPYQSTITVTEDTSNNVNNYHTKIGTEETNTTTEYSVEDSTTTLAFINEKTPVCKIGNRTFQTIKSAVEYAEANHLDATIELMLANYVMPAEDVATISSNRSIILKTATDFEGEGNAVIQRTSTGSILVNRGTLSIEGVTIDGGSGSAQDAMIVNDGTLNVESDAVLRNATNVGTENNGGAIRSTGGTVNLYGSITGCTAVHGGAVWSSNTEVNVEDGTLSGNTAVGSNTVGSNAVAARGGAICSVGGAVNVRGGSITGNRAEDSVSPRPGYGGAIYVSDDGTVNVTGGLIGSTTVGGEPVGSANRAQTNGSAIYISAGTAAFSGGTISGNQTLSPNGGAVGVASEEVHLSFFGTPVITGNMWNVGEESAPANVCMDKDADTVITSLGLNDGAVIGVYVPGNDQLYQNRGVTNTVFGTYTNEDGIDSFQNDRTPGMRVEAKNSKMVWGKGLTIEIHEVSTINSFPPSPSSDAKNTVSYYPTETENNVSDIAAKQSVTAGYTFACAFVKVKDTNNNLVYSNQIKAVNWSGAISNWSFVDWNGATVTPAEGAEELIVYYAPPTYLTITNNYTSVLTLTNLTVNGINVGATHFGLVVAKNGQTISDFPPVEASDLTLNPNQTIKLMFPGARNTPYTLSGTFAGVTAATSIAFYRTEDSETSITTDAAGSFTLSAQNTLNSADAIDITFGGEAKICKIVELNPDNTVKEEHYYSSLQAAVRDGATNYDAYKVTVHIDEDGDPSTTADNYDVQTVKIEMLQDYLLRSTDSPDIPSGKSFTFTTAKQGETRGDLFYTGSGTEGTNPDYRAKISQDQGNTNSFIKCTTGGAGTELIVENLVFEGKQLNAKSTNGGVINTMDCGLTIRNTDFKNFNAGNGGAVFAQFGGENKPVRNKLLGACESKYEEENNRVKITDTNFDTCSSQASDDRFGGGGIWTNTRALTLTNCNFSNCTATQQGGAVYHRIDREYTYAASSTTDVTNCKFEHCNASAAGGLEINAYTTTITGGLFDDCQALTRNGGGFNAYLRIEDYKGEKTLDAVTEPTSLTITGTAFKNCFAKQNGGVFRTMMNTTVTACTFTDNTANGNGGGIAQTDTNYNLILDSCTITGNKAGGQGGGVYVGGKGNLTLCNGTSITGNSLTQNVTNVNNNAAGVYYAGTLTIGPKDSTDPTVADTVIVKNNTQLDGSPSNLRLNISTTNYVQVKSNLSEESEIHVLNAGAAGTRFGTADGIPNPTGFSAASNTHAFVGDNRDTYGIVKRDTTNELVWRGIPICKITDESGNLLYLDPKGNDPAVFDKLYDGGYGSFSKIGAFSYLRNTGDDLEFYRKDGSQYPRYTENKFTVKMLVQDYKLGTCITSNQNSNITITLTTESETEGVLFPYRGEQGTVCTIIKHENFSAKDSMITAKVNLTLTNIVLDGNNSLHDQPSQGGAIAMMKDKANATLTLGPGCVLRNGKTSHFGGGVFIRSGGGSLVINGGRIENCSTTDSDGKGGAGVYIASGKTITFSSGSIVGCTSASSGGGVYVENGTFEMSGGSIEDCTAVNDGGNGGGVFVANSKTMTMSGGTISGNRASGNGGGIAVGGSNTRLYFSGDCVVYDNYKGATGDTQCNLELSEDTKEIINVAAAGMGENSRIGVYASDDYLDKRGVKGMTFGTWNENTDNLFQFVNDRNPGLRAADRSQPEPAHAKEIWWQEMQSLVVRNTVVSDRSSDKSSANVFHYVVQLSNTSICTSESPVIFGAGSTKMTFIGGKAEFDLAHGEYKEAVYLPTVNISGTVTITQTEKSGFTTEVDETFTNKKQDEFGAKDGSGQTILVHTAYFTNTRKTGDLRVTKQVETTKPEDEDREFSFTVQLSDITLSKTYGDLTFSRGVATFKLKKNETKRAIGLPTGIDYSVNETADSDFNTSIKVNSEEPVQGTMISRQALNAGTNANVVVVTNSRKVGGLTVTNHVVSDAQADRARKFRFTVTLSDTSINGDYGDMTFKDGVSSFQLADSESKAARGLPAGITYTVTGDEAPEGFTRKFTRASGTIGTTIIDSTFTYTRQTGRLTIQKFINTDRSADNNEKFTFTVKLGTLNEGTFTPDTSINKTYSSVAFTNGEGTVVITGPTAKTIVGLPQGTDYQVTESGKANFTLSSSTGTTGTIGATESTAEFTNTRATGSLTVSKTVVSDLSADNDVEFNFTVRLGDAKINRTYSGVTFTNGVGTFTLKHGADKVIEGLPTDVSYTVSESSNSSFTTTSSNASGTISTAGATAAFTNTRKTGALAVRKNLRSDLAADSALDFQFTVRLGTLNGEDLTVDTSINKIYGDMEFTNGVATVTVKGGETKTATRLPMSIGYEVVENGWLDGTTPKTDGFTTSSVRSKGTIGTSTITATFTNVRQNGSLTLRKVVDSDRSADHNVYYQFHVTLSDTSFNKYGFTNGEGDFQIKGDRSRVINGLPLNMGYTVTETPVADMTPTSYGESGTITASGAEAVFTNTRNTDLLTVTKTVDSDFMDDTYPDEVRDDLKSFNFTVQLVGESTLDKTYTATVKKAGEADRSVDIEFQRGKGSVSLKHGESLELQLPLGASYYVTEQSNADYTVTSTGQSGTITSGGATAAFTNTRKKHNLSITKSVVNGIASDHNDDFLFTIRLGTLAGSTLTPFTGFTQDCSGTVKKSGAADSPTTVSFNQGVATDVPLKWGETLSLDLPVGIGYEVIEQTDPNSQFEDPEYLGYSTGTIGASSWTTVVNTRKVKGLQVKKTLQSLLDSDSTQDFAFHVELGSWSGSVFTPDDTIDETYGEVVFTAGAADFPLRKGQHKLITGLPQGIGYRMTETTADGFLPQKEHGGTVGSQSSIVETFANVRAVCKITDESGALLYYQDDTGFRQPAVYGAVSDAFDRLNLPERGLYTDPDCTQSYTSAVCKVELLVPECPVNTRLEVPAGLTVTLTTASRNNTDHYPYIGAFGTHAVLLRENRFADSMLLVEGNLTLTNVILDGNGTATISADGGAANVASSGHLTITEGAVLRNTKTSGKGAAVFAADRAVVELNAGRIENNKGNYGAVYLSDGSTLRIQGAPEFEDNITPGVTVTQNNVTDTQHQDIYLAEEHENAPTSIVVTGDLTGTPGSIYVWAQSEYHYVQLKPFATLEASVTLNAEHLKVFRNAQGDDRTENRTDSYLYGRPKDEDDSDEAEGYVYWNGIKGSARVILVKVLRSGNSYRALSDKVFTVYTKGGSIAKGSVWDDSQNKYVDAQLKDLSSDKGGSFFIGELPYGEYYAMEERVSGKFRFIIDKGGVVEITDPTTTPKKTRPVKTVSLS